MWQCSNSTDTTTRDEMDLSLDLFCSISNLISGDLGNSEGCVRLGRFFHVDWSRNHTNIWSGGRFYDCLECRTHFLLRTHDFEKNYSISLR